MYEKYGENFKELRSVTMAKIYNVPKKIVVWI